MMFVTKASFSLYLIVASVIVKSVSSAPYEKKKQKNGFIHQISDDLSNAKSSGSVAGSKVLNSRLHWKNNSNDANDRKEMLLVDVTSSIGDGNNKKSTLRSVLEATDSFEITGCLSSGFACSGYLDMSALNMIENLPSIGRITPAIMTTDVSSDTYPFNGSGRSPGSVVALQISKIRERFPELTGKGLTIGVLSDSFDCLKGYDTDISTGDLPGGIEVLKEGPCPGGTDEGRAMSQLIHDIAPEAKLKFHTAFLGQFDFANGIRELANAGCDVIVDDVGYFAETMFQEGPIAQAASDVAQAGVAYFCAAGNQKNEAWEGEFKSTTCTFKSFTDEFTCHDFGNGNFKQRINVAYNTFLFFQWDDPTRFDNVGVGPSSDLALLFLDVNTGDIIYIFNDDNIATEASFEAGGIPAGEYDLVIDLSSGPGPTSMKWIHVNRGIQFANPQLNGSWLIPQGNTAFTAAIGAANDVQKFGELNIEPFSSSGGGSPIVFDRDGTRFHVPKIFHQPRVVGPDGSENTFFGAKKYNIAMGEEEKFRFFGTSAAAPNVAALALLVLQTNPALTPNELYALLETTAINMGEPGFDFDTGNGFVNGYFAVLKAKKKKKFKRFKKKNKLSYCDYDQF